MVLLPIGIPVGLAGLLAFLWGIYGGSGDKHVPTLPTGPQ
jgi:cbb3-type cytochrome oxidase maturation protein